MAEHDETRAARWISHGLETLIASLEADKSRSAETSDFDVLVVGSGYGGAVVAAELSRMRGDRRIAVLERGTEHLPGSFPSRFSELAGHVRFSTPKSKRPRGRREGLFDVRVGEDLCAVVASGVGGGSLMNAGVMELPCPSVFDHAAWPQALRGAANADALFELGRGLRDRLGATQSVTTVAAPLPRKFVALRKLGEGRTRSVPVTVALEATGPNGKFATAAGIEVDTCVRCGDCATGCNHNAKVSLDTTLLAEAVRHGAEIFSGATVLRIEKLDPKKGADSLWQLHVAYTDEALRRRQGLPLALRAQRVVLSAGTLGSTEILMRSSGNDKLQFSRLLGSRISANGDLIAVAYDSSVEAHCVADETVDPQGVPAADRIGPTITGMADFRQTEDVVVQELSVPGPLRRVFEEAVTTATAVHLLAEPDTRSHGPGAPLRDPCAVNREAIDKTLVVAMIGHDSADGVLAYNEGMEWNDGDGATTIRWRSLRDDPAFIERDRRFKKRLQDSGVKGRAVPNPLWRLLPDELEYLFDGENGPLLTVHPLGGCVMGDDISQGVVDDCGRVFDADPQAALAVHKGLVVLDGSIVPTSLGINPALSIASLALRAVTRLRTEWNYVTPPAALQPLVHRPRFRRPKVIASPQPTYIEVLERLSGPVWMPLAGGSLHRLHAELTMRFDPVEVNALRASGTKKPMQLQAGQGRLRIFDKAPRDDCEARDRDALLVARVSGTLQLLHHEPSCSLQRRLRGWWAWFRNRGLRDSVLWVIDKLKGEAPRVDDGKGFWADALGRLKSSWDLSSRAGAVRLFNYELEVEKIIGGSWPDSRSAAFTGQALHGEKRLTYSRRGNPWRQLMEVSFGKFPGAVGQPTLKLDPGYLARQGMPLFRVVRQQDQPSALIDVASLMLYVLRVLVHVHVWSFRAPDKPRERDIQRLPGVVPGLPEPWSKHFTVGQPLNSESVSIRLTRYRFGEMQRRRAIARQPESKQSVETPVLLIHGYSASGNTFAHHAVRPNLASALWNAGRDVWIVDMRTSSGMPHARHAWNFEQVAMADIPMAIHQVCLLSGGNKIDVFAHCMGSAMLGMALLGDIVPGEPFEDQRRDMRLRIRRLAISQVAPAVVFTPANVFRAYAMRFLKHYLPLTDYEFRPSSEPKLTDQLIDRLLATLPYPEDEFDRENPLWTPWRRTPWVGTRHRMDAMYGRDFSVNNLSQGMLDHIDDHFGPLSVETVSQAIHFARFRTITDKHGFNAYVTPQKLRDNFTFPVFHVHGDENGLASRRTAEHFQKVLQDSAERFDDKAAFDHKSYPKTGHQDCLIGRGAAAVFKDVVAFFDRPDSPSQVQPDSPGRITFASQVPAFGVRLDPDEGTAKPTYSVGDHGGRGAPVVALLVAVVEHEGRFMPLMNGVPVPPTPENLQSLIRWAVLQGTGDMSKVARFRFDLDPKPIPDGADGMLTLLMYEQSHNVGEPAHPVADADANLNSLVDSLAANIHHQAKVLLQGEFIDPIILPRLDELQLMVMEGIVRSVYEVFDETGHAALGLGVLRRTASHSNSSKPADQKTFALASCQYPGGMLDRTPPGVPDSAAAGPADASYMRLNALLAGGGGPVPEFLVLAGDQVYADATAGLFDPAVPDDRFRLSCQAFFGARGPRAVLSKLPARMQLDDHEIDDNWEPLDPVVVGQAQHRRNEKLKDEGVDAYQRNQNDVAGKAGQTPTLWGSLPLGGLSFFFADTRISRTARLAHTAAAADLLGPCQTRELEEWLDDATLPSPRFIVSASMVLPRRLAVAQGKGAATLRSDAWDGYPASLHRLLAKVYERDRSDVVFLSGDEHLSNLAHIEIRKDGSSKVVVAHSMHSSALYAPYPFANAVEEDFAATETFRFTVGRAGYSCRVTTEFPGIGDGFAVFTLSGTSSPWTAQVSFHGTSRCDMLPFTLT